MQNENQKKSKPDGKEGRQLRSVLANLGWNASKVAKAIDRNKSTVYTWFNSEVISKDRLILLDYCIEYDWSEFENGKNLFEGSHYNNSYSSKFYTVSHLSHNIAERTSKYFSYFESRILSAKKEISTYDYLQPFWSSISEDLHITDRFNVYYGRLKEKALKESDLKINRVIALNCNRIFELTKEAPIKFIQQMPLPLYNHISDCFSVMENRFKLYFHVLADTRYNFAVVDDKTTILELDKDLAEVTSRHNIISIHAERNETEQLFASEFQD